MDEPIDAEPRNIKNGDMIRIFNDRGEVRINVKNYPRIIPGLWHLSEGLGIHQIKIVSIIQVALMYLRHNAHHRLQVIRNILI